MKKKTNILTMTGLLTLSVLFTALVFPTNPSNGVIETPTDDFAQGETINFKKGMLVGESSEVEVSKTFVQYGTIEHEGSSIYAMRFATALKGDLTSITYQRGHVDGLDDAGPVDVTTIYKGIKSNDSIYYYHPEASEDGLTTVESYAGDYYWACFTIRFTSGETHQNKDFPISLSVNGEVVSERTANLGELIELDSHGCNLCNGCKDSTCESHSQKCTCEKTEFSSIDSRVGLTSTPNNNAYKNESGQFVISLKAYGDTITLTYNIYAASDCKANLYFNMSGLLAAHNINEIFSSVTVNGDSVALDSMIHVADELYFSFDDIFVGEVSLTEGANEIVMVYSVTSREYHTNFRSLMLETNKVELRWYEKVATAFYAVDSHTILEHDNTSDPNVIFKNTNQNTISFNKIGNTTATLTYNIKATSDCVADLSITATSLPGAVNINKIFKYISVNGVNLNIDTQVFHDGKMWSTYAEIAIGEVSLNEGQNVIKVSYSLPDSTLCTNFRGITLTTYGGVYWYE